jgi:hypothetical protein
MAEFWAECKDFFAQKRGRWNLLFSIDYLLFFEIAAPLGSSQ